MPGAERVEIVPAEDAGRMHVVEDELHGVIPDRLDADDLDVALARHRLALGRAVPLHLGRGARHPQVFGRKLESRAVVEGDAQAALVLGEPDLGRPALRVHATPSNGRVKRRAALTPPPQALHYRLNPKA